MQEELRSDEGSYEVPMPLQKNQQVTLSITDMTENGEGIGRADGYPLFVKDAVVGDTVEAVVTKALKSYGYGRALKITEPSADRVTPRCPISAPCGGCQLQALSYPAQLAFKENKVKQHLTRLGGFDGGLLAEISEKIIGADSPFGYRNKAHIPFGTDREGRLIAGYYAGRSHRIVPMTGCPLNQDGFDQVLSLLLDFAREHRLSAYDEETGRGLLRHALIRRAKGSGQWMVSLVINGRRLPHADELVRCLKQVPGIADISLNINTRRDNVILGDELIPLFGPGYIEEQIGELRFHLSPLSFFQVNPEQTEKLYAKALEYAGLTGKENVWDLYCGTGTISLFLAKKAARVRGVEIVAPAIENAKENARLNGIGNAEFFVGKSEEVFPDYLAAHPEESPDTVVLDPPRAGCGGALLDALLACIPQRIVYVSCNSATLARDLKQLCEGGEYRLEKVCPVDMFPQTTHVECVVLLSKGNMSTKHIRVEFDLEDLDTSGLQTGATYDEIREWIQEKYGFHVSRLNIAQIKRKHGLDMRENYNLPKSEDSRQPNCPEEKEKAIEEALKHFKMI